ncbi:MAG: caspase family protein [Pseudomonadota bacterium]
MAITRAYALTQVWLVQLLLALVLFSVSPILRGDDSTRHALVIGNSAYRYGHLKNPANDARAMARALQNLGFRTELLVDANQRDMEQAIDRLGHHIRLGGTGLFYFAGHGVEVGGENYLVPLGVDILSEQDVRYKAVALGQVMDRMQQAQNGLNIVILDACRNNPLPKKSRSLSRGLANVDAPRGSIVAYATSPGSVADDGYGRHSPYTQVLLDKIQVPGLKIEDVFKEVLKGVHQQTRGVQTPWVSSSFVGDFYFSGPVSITVNSPTIVVTPAAPAPKSDIAHAAGSKSSDRVSCVYPLLDTVPGIGEISTNEVVYVANNRRCKDGETLKITGGSLRTGQARKYECVVCEMP